VPSIILEVSRLARREAVAPGRLHQRAPGMAVAGDGDRPMAPSSAWAVLTGHQTQVGHELPGRLEATDVAQFRQQCQHRFQISPFHRFEISGFQRFVLS